MDDSQFRKGKDRLLAKYQREHRQIYSEIGGHNFSYEPGFLYDSQNSLEIGLKFELSDLNYKILEQAVSRDLKQSEIEYNSAYQELFIQWEIEKAILLSDLAKELAEIQQSNKEDEFELELLFIELSKRGVLLLSTKASIELELEQLRRQLAELGGQTGAYEVQLANAKMLTAQKKLELIPYTQTLIEKEKDIIEKAYELLTFVSLLTDQQSIIAEKEVILSEKRVIIAGENLEIFGLKLNEIEDKTALLDKKGSIISVEQNIIDLKSLFIESELAISQKKKDLIEKEDEVLINRSNLIERKGDSLSLRATVLTKEAEIATEEAKLIPLIVEIVEAEKDVIEKQIEVVEAEANIIVTYEDLLEEEHLMIALLQEIALIEKDISNKIKEAITANEAVISKTRTLLHTKGTVTIPVREELIEKEVEKQSESNILITEEKLAARFKIDHLSPEIKTLTIKIEAYIIAIKNQAEIQLKIIEKRYEISEILTQRIGKKEEALVIKALVASKLEELASLLSDLVAYKGESLSLVTSDLMNAYTKLAEEIPTQTNLKVEIAKIEKQMSELMVRQATGDFDISALNSLHQEALSTLSIAEIAINTQNSLNSMARYEQESSNLTDYVGKYISVHQETLEFQELSFNNLIGYREGNKEIGIDIHQTKVEDLEAARKTDILSRRTSAVNKIRNDANLRIASQGITARLNHILTQE